MRHLITIQPVDQVKHHYNDNYHSFLSLETLVCVRKIDKKRSFFLSFCFFSPNDSMVAIQQPFKEWSYFTNAQDSLRLLNDVCSLWKQCTVCSSSSLLLHSFLFFSLSFSFFLSHQTLEPAMHLCGASCCWSRAQKQNVISLTFISPPPPPPPPPAPPPPPPVTL